MGKIRLDKYLADAGEGTRSQVKELIRRGQVLVDGVCVKTPEYKLDTDTAKVMCRGKELSREGLVYYLFHKPAGCLTATEDVSQPVVMDYLKEAPGKGLFPVGRLDKDTEGLLLITNDGELAHGLLSPRRHVEKTYYVEVRGVLTEKEEELFASGMEIGDEKPALPARLDILESGRRSKARVTIREGRYHQIKRMFAAAGLEVTYLKRLSMGGLTLPEELGKGAFRALTLEEVRRLKEAAAGGRISEEKPGPPA